MVKLIKENSMGNDGPQTPQEFEKQLSKFKAKGLICFEEITDYSLITDNKVN